LALFSRRVIQRLIRDNASFMSLRQRERHAAAINRGTPETVAVEWEIAVLHGLSRLAQIEHEPSLGRTRPDVLARSTRSLHTDLFLADIATVFEVGRDELNPIDALSEEVRKAGKTLGLSPGGFRLDVKGRLEGPTGNQVMRLKLPPKAELQPFFRSRVLPYVEQCASDPILPRELRIVEEDVEFILIYNPAERYFSQSHPSYNTSYSATRNPIHNVLKRKLRQLKDTESHAPLGVILCAADSNLDDNRSGSGFSTGQVIQDFFRQNRSLSFVLTLWAEDPWSRDPGEINGQLYTNSLAACPLSREAIGILAALPKTLPEPRNSGTNALNELAFHRWKRGRYFYGSWSMSQNEIKISARVLLELLAGRISLDEFLDVHGRSRGWVPPFEQKVRQGQLLIDAEIQPVPDRDDDWIIFRFGTPDPAIAPLRPE